MKNVKVIKGINPLKLMLRSIIFQAGLAFLSKSSWSIHLFFLQYMKCYRVFDFFIEEDVTRSKIGFFSSTQTFRLYRINFGVKTEVGKFLLMSNSEKLDICFMGVSAISPEQMRQCQKLIEIISAGMKPFFNNAELIATCPDFQSIDIRMSGLNILALSAAQRSGALKPQG